MSAHLDTYPRPADRQAGPVALLGFACSKRDEHTGANPGVIALITPEESLSG